MASGTGTDDKVQYYLCEVVEQDDGSSYNEDDYTIKCKILTSLAIPDVNIDKDYTSINNNNNDPNNGMLGDIFLHNVQLMPMVDDGILYIPSIGSIVTVLNSKQQNPLVIQYSSLDSLEYNIIKDFTIDVGEVDSPNVAKLSLQSATASFGIYLEDSQTNIEVIDNKITITTKDNGSIIIDGENILFNGGDNGGLVKVNDLVSKVNIIENDLNTLKNAIAGWTPVLNDGGTALKTATSAWFAATITNTTAADLKNDKVKH